jgi:hypothetical protein
MDLLVSSVTAPRRRNKARQAWLSTVIPDAEPDGAPHMFQVSMAAPGLRSGDPLFNEPGEVIGILTIEGEGHSTHSLPVAALPRTVSGRLSL